MSWENRYGLLCKFLANKEINIKFLTTCLQMFVIIKPIVFVQFIIYF